VKMITWVWRTLFVPSMICCPHSWFQLFDFRQISSMQQITGTKAMSGPASFTGLEFSRHVKLVVLKPETCPLCIEVEKDLYQVKFIVWPWMCLDSRYEQLVAGSPLQAVS
jgi:hypothetical protein